MTRLMAHKIVVDGVAYAMSIVTIYNDGSIDIQPYNGEIPATSFYNGELRVETCPGQMPTVYHNNKPIKITH